MSDKAQRDTAGEPGGLAARRLAFLGELSARMTCPGDPLTQLGRSLPQILALTAAEGGRLLVQPDAIVQPVCPTALGWPEADSALPVSLSDFTAPGRAPGKTEAKGLLRVSIVLGDDPVAAIEILIERDSGAKASTGAMAFLEALTGLVGLALAKAQAEQDQVQQQQIGRDLKLAAELQQSLQPDSDPALLPIWGVNLPARNLSGDFFDFFQLDGGRIAFALGDVSGKGTNAALLMAKTVSLFRCLAKRIDGPARLLEALNEELCETATRGMFVTMVAGHYCKDNGRIVFANAGHQPPLLRRLDRSYETFPAKAQPLGITPAIGMTEEYVQPDGGEFYVFTDGLTEYRYASGEELGVDGLIQLLEAHAEAPLAERLQSLLETLDQETGWEARDDLTVLAIDDSWVRTGGGAERPGANGTLLEAAS